MTDENPKEITFLYKLVKSFQRELTTIMKEQLVHTGPFVCKYNELRKLVKKAFPEVKKYSKVISVATVLRSPQFEISQFSTVKMETSSLIDFLESKLDKSEEIIKNILGALTRKLRTTFREEPKNERDVQDKVDTVLGVLDFNYLREIVAIPYSSKSFKPDFTFEAKKTALEIKFCN